MKPGQWAQLPGSIWASVFLQLQSWTAYSSLELPYAVFQARAKHQCWLLQLRTVCHTFAEQPELGSTLTVDERLNDSPLIADLTRWIQNHGKISNFATNVTNHNNLMEMLETLKSCSSGVAKVYIVTPPEGVVKCLPLLSTLCHITQCFFVLGWHISDVQIGLSALQALPDLTELGVAGGGGVFKGIETLPRLCFLRFEDARNDCESDSCSVSSLTKLELCNAELLRFHDTGVSSCPQLRVLICEQSTIGSVDSEETLKAARFSDHCKVPSSCSNLTALHTLVIKGNMPEWTWVSSMVALQHLEIETAEAQFGRGFVNLTNLQLLHVRYSKTGRRGNARVHFGFDWSLLVSLRILQLECVGLYWQVMVGLADIPSLQEVFFISMHGYNVYTASQMAQLGFLLGQRRPGVQFVMG